MIQRITPKLTSPVLVLVITLLIAINAEAQSKPRVAVLEFGYATVYDSVSAIFGRNENIGRGIAGLLEDKLVQSGNFIMVDRRAVQQVLQEQNFGAGGRVDPATAAKIGKMLGVDALVVGDITAFGRDDSRSNKGGIGGVFIPAPIIGGIILKKQEAKAVVGITFRMVQAETGQILMSGTTKGTSKRESKSFAVGGIIGFGGGAAGNGQRSENFAETIIGEAVMDAVENLSALIKQRGSQVPEPKKVLEGLVAAANGSTLVINLGQNAGAKVGDRLQVRRVTQEVKDPVTKQVIHRMTDPVGEIVLTQVHDRAAVGTFTGKSVAQVGDQVSNH